jgi:hypothetical protein
MYFLACRAHETGEYDRLDDLTDEQRLIVDGIEDSRPTVSGLAFVLGMTTETLRAYAQKDEFSATVKRAKQRIERYLEQNLYGHAVTGTIFNLKNNFGWKDKTEQEVTQSIEVSGMSDSELERIANGKSS